MNRTDGGGRLDAAGGSGPWLLLVAVWVPVTLAGMWWTAGRTASWLSGRGWAGPPFGLPFVRAQLLHGPTSVWPGISTAAVTVVFIVELLTISAATSEAHPWRASLYARFRRRKGGSPWGT